MIVDLGENEHSHDSATNVQNLLAMEARVTGHPYVLVIEETRNRGVLGMQRGGVNLQHRNGAQNKYHAQQRPVEVTETHESAHGLSFPSPCLA